MRTQGFPAGALAAGAVVSVLCAVTSCTTPDISSDVPIVSGPVSVPEIGQTIDQNAPPGARAPVGHLVPNVVGRNHQEAQDALQAAGFYELAEEDATGRGRMLVYDRNWVVVEQVPAAGTVADPKQRILLRSKKFTD